MDWLYDLTHFRDFSFVFMPVISIGAPPAWIRYLVGPKIIRVKFVIVLTSTQEDRRLSDPGVSWNFGAAYNPFQENSYPIWGQGDNNGFAFDFGKFTYSLGEKLKASFSVVNLGRIHWISG